MPDLRPSLRALEANRRAQDESPAELGDPAVPPPRQLGARLQLEGVAHGVALLVAHQPPLAHAEARLVVHAPLEPPAIAQPVAPRPQPDVLERRREQREARPQGAVVLRLVEPRGLLARRDADDRPPPAGREELQPR